MTHQKFWQLAKHFIFDILHFDGKFFHTLLFIFTRPGFVAKQYVQGKRISYLDPIRMYLFTSALFFLIFFSVKSFQINTENKTGPLSRTDRMEMVAKVQKKLANHPGDSVLLKSMAVLQDTTKALNPDSLDLDQKTIDFADRKYPSVQVYDSIQSALVNGQRDGWIKRSLIRQTIKVNGKYGNGREMVNAYIETFLHKMPYLLFLSLPFFALILKLLYSRRKNFFYSDHAVFTLYHYIFSFILLLLVLGSSSLQDWSHWGLFGWLTSAFLLGWPVYLFLEMRRFYGQGIARTLGKFLLLNMAGSIILILLFIIFFVFSIFQL